jgi:indolepyruvate ferredoxin oxidoreductase, alpha subunit
MEVSFSHEIKSLRLGAGQTFHGEGILAITKALLQSGVAYVGGYQGAPVSHLLDVMVQAKPYMDELGVHVEACANEASAAAMLGASIHYPLRGAVTWKSIVGTNVASDALSNLSSPGVKGGALIVVGEDYGEGASVIQERTQAYALKSSMCLLDPRPDLGLMVRMVEEGFRLSESSNMPCILELRIRACHMRGSFEAKDNVPPAVSTRVLLEEPASFDYSKLAHPPATFRQEKLKGDERIPAARKYIAENKLNELMPGKHADVGIIVQGGLYNSLVRSLQHLGVADAFGESDIPLLVLNVTYPLVPEQVADFCVGKRGVLVVEEGQPEYIEQEIATLLRRRDLQTRLHGKDLLPAAGEYSVEVLTQGLLGFCERYLPATLAREWLVGNRARREAVAAQLSKPLPNRPPSFCIGCPERPVFSALKLAQQDVGPVHIAADIGCHAFGTFEPFSMGHSILGYGMSLASRAGVSPVMQRRTLSIMGDGGFWHNGLTSGVGNAVFNKSDNVLIIVDNGYSAATGGQDIPSSYNDNANRGTKNSIEKAVRGVGVEWVKTLTHTYDVAKMRDTLREALTTTITGPKVIVAQSECMLNKQRRIRPLIRKAAQRGERVVRERFGVDADTCTGDHSCIRLSGCPSLTIAPNPDPLRREPVTKVINSCVGCGLCGEVAHAAVLCPSFYKAQIVSNPSRWDRLRQRLRGAVIGHLQRREARARERYAF